MKGDQEKIMARMVAEMKANMKTQMAKMKSEMKPNQEHLVASLGKIKAKMEACLEKMEVYALRMEAN
jgi:hypothetical protein